MRALNIIQLLVIGLLPVVAHAENAVDVEWRHKIEVADLPSAVALLQSQKDVWPFLLSVDSIMTQSPESRPALLAWHDLAVNMIEKLQKYDDAVSETNILPAVRLYAALAAEMRARGGYSNYIIANTGETLAVGRLSVLLATKPDTCELVKKALADLPASELPDEALQQVFRTELPATNAPALQQEPLSFAALLQVLQLDQRAFFLHCVLDSISTRQLLAKRDLASLLWRWMNTTATIKMHLSGYIAFLERGGNYSDHLIADVSDWDQKMGPVEKTYGCPMLGIPALRPSHLGMWLKACKNGFSKTPYYAIAFK